MPPAFSSSWHNFYNQDKWIKSLWTLCNCLGWQRLLVLNGTKWFGNVLLRRRYCLACKLTTCVQLSNIDTERRIPVEHLISPLIPFMRKNFEGVTPIYLDCKFIFGLSIIQFASLTSEMVLLSTGDIMKRNEKGNGIAWRTGWQTWALNRSIPCVFHSLFFFLSRVNHN